MVVGEVERWSGDALVGRSGGFGDYIVLIFSRARHQSMVHGLQELKNSKIFEREYLFSKGCVTFHHIH